MKSARSAALARGVQDLPPLRGAALELLRALDDPSISLDALAAKIALDPMITAKLLRLANSPFFGLSRQIATAFDATTVLGVRTVKKLATAAAIVGAFDASRCTGFDLTAFWRHSIGTAMVAEAMAPLCRSEEIDASMAFGFGLLHDIGRVAFATSVPADYAEALVQQQLLDLPLLEAEQAVLGVTHADLGAKLAEQWMLAPHLVQAIALHHQPPSEGPAAAILDLIHVADNVAHGLGLGGEPSEAVPPLNLPSWQRLALDTESLVHLFGDIEARHELLCQLMLREV